MNAAASEMIYVLVYFSRYRVTFISLKYEKKKTIYNHEAYLFFSTTYPTQMLM